jgi:hypothetical protein
MKGRIYDPQLGRFLTPDPIVGAPLYGQSWNPYSYVLNNPLALVDPSGFEEAIPPVLPNQPELYACIGPRCTDDPPPPKGPEERPQGTQNATDARDNGAAHPPNDVGTTGNTSGYVPQPTTGPQNGGDPTPTDWRQHPVVQIEGGFLGGLLLGVIPYAGLGQHFLSAAGVLPSGTRAANIGLAIGEVVGGIALLVGGVAGDAAGAVASATGVGALAGVPAIVASTAVAVGGVANIAAGLHGLGQAFSMGSGPKAGSAGGPGSGKRFPDSAKDRAEAEANGKCVFCGKDTERTPGPNQRNTDHAVPKSRGGNNTPDNAQNTCRDCNLRKGARTTAEFTDDD